jgi:hypothetical protein
MSTTWQKCACGENAQPSYVTKVMLQPYAGVDMNRLGANQRGFFSCMLCSRHFAQAKTMPELGGVQAHSA